MNREVFSKMKKDIEIEMTTLEVMIKKLSLTNEEMKPVLKQITIIRKATTPRKSLRVHNTNSGLQKLLKISKEMAAFAGWGDEELHSRVDVTKVICEYIKKNNIQKENDKRIIILDQRLKDILQYNGDEITYPHIQKYISKHFFKVENTLLENEELKDVESINTIDDVPPTDVLVENLTPVVVSNTSDTPVKKHRKKINNLK